MLGELLALLISAYVFGPGATLTAFIERYNDKLLALTLLTLYTLPIPLVYYTSTKLDLRSGESGHFRHFVENMGKSVRDRSSFTGRLLEKLSAMLGTKGDLLFLVIINAGMGFIWATFISYVLHVPIRKAVIAISAGGVLVVSLWYMAVKTAHDLFGTALTVPLLAIIIVSILYSYVNTVLKHRSLLHNK